MYTLRYVSGTPIVKVGDLITRIDGAWVLTSIEKKSAWYVLVYQPSWILRYKEVN